MRGFFLYWGRRDNAAAARAFEHAVRAMPNSADAIYNLALVHRRSGRWQEALKGFARAQELDPRNPRIARETGYTFEMVRDYFGAVKVFRRQQTLTPQDPALQALLVVTQLCVDGSLEQAVTTLGRLPPDNDGILAKWVALLEAWRGRSVEALAALPPLLARAGVGLAEELLLQARVRQLAGDPAWRPLAERACGILRPEVEVEHAAAAVPMMMLATLEAMLGDRELALRHAYRAVELRLASGDAVLGAVLSGVRLIRREPALLHVLALLGERERFFVQLEAVLNMPSALDPMMLRIEPAFAPLRDDPRFEVLLDQARMPLF